MKEPSVKNLLFGEAAIRDRVATLAERIAADHPGREITLIGVLRGSFMFLADLVRVLHGHGIAAQIDFLMLESYGSATVSSGAVRMLKDFSIDVAGREVLLVDDILDTGRTLSFARRHILERGAAACRTCVLLDKPARRAVPFEADYAGFQVPDVFVVGYGLDYDGRCREWPYLAELKENDHGG
ncbi:MAG: hypoxanthine phosphoribosyltransferase [Kiritimatiellia bacterium]|nr:hypoxanthine phosphoribosyltransferase [Kiritimatiellia bacterium]